MSNISFQEFYQNSPVCKVFSHEFELYLQNYLKNKLQGTQTLLSAINYTILGNAKRLRPFLLYLTGSIFKIDSNILYHIGLALEFLHTYSLIHDDLPALDNDDIRRGKPSCHKEFSESTAILTGDSLLTLAFNILSDENLKITESIKLKIINITSQFLGIEGMIGGQELDLLYTKDLARYNSLTAKDILHIHTLKTAKFIELTFQITSLIANLSPKRNQHFTSFGSAVGIMFQILDDIEDYKQNTQSLNLLNILSKNDIKNYLTNLLNQSKYDIQESSITSNDLINLQESIYFSAISLLSK